MKQTKWKSNGGLEKTVKKIKEMKQPSLLVGVFENARYLDNTPVAQVAFWQEYGTVDEDDNQIIPARAAFRIALKEKQDQWIDNTIKYLEYTGISQDPDALTKAYDVLGLQAVDDIKKQIGSNTPPPLAAATVKRKQKLGLADPAVTLVETGLYQRSITHKVDVK